MCKYCENIDHVIKVACEDAKNGDKTNPLGELFFTYQIGQRGIFQCALGEDAEDHCVLFADGQVIVFEGTNSFATYYKANSLQNKKIFKYCPHCGRKLAD